jgi:predicted DCC family thiol-disulfide oxidoreductase YuxK
VLFDGVCNFCNAAVRFIASNDPRGRFAFLPLQSPRARALLGNDGYAEALRDGAAPETVVLLDRGRRYERSDAALHIALDLRRPWPLAFAAILIPRAWRDAAYSLIARNRYLLFGKKDVCPLPPSALRERFLDPEWGEPAAETP